MTIRREVYLLGEYTSLLICSSFLNLLISSGIRPSRPMPLRHQLRLFLYGTQGYSDPQLLTDPCEVFTR